jgi:hypothetical protein
MYVGPFLGAGYNFSIGRPITQCKCEYPGGEGAGALFGVMIDYPIESDFSITAAIGYHSLKTSYSKYDQRIIVSDIDSNLVYQSVSLRQQADVSLNVIELALTGKWYTGRRHFYVFGGPVFGVDIYDRLHETETIRIQGYNYPGTGLTEQVLFDDVLEKLYNKPQLRIAVIIGGGYDFAVSPRWSLSPELSLTLPILPVTTSVPHWRIAGLQFLVALKYAL